MSQWWKNLAQMTTAHKVVVVGYLVLFPFIVANGVLLFVFHSNVLMWSNLLLGPLCVALVVVLYRKSMRDSAREFVDETIPPSGSGERDEG